LGTFWINHSGSIPSTLEHVGHLQGAIAGEEQLQVAGNHKIFKQLTAENDKKKRNKKSLNEP
jgi:hypothetical protein